MRLERAHEPGQVPQVRLSAAGEEMSDLVFYLANLALLALALAAGVWLQVVRDERG